MTPTTSPTSPRPATSSLQRRLTAAFAVTAILLTAVVGAAVALAVRVERTQDQVVDRLFEAYAISNDLFVSVVDSETSVRGYALTGDPQFLGPYLTGGEADGRAFQRLLRLVEPFPKVTASLGVAAERAGAWNREWAEPTVELVQTSGLGAVTPADVARGKELFDAVRTDFNAYRQELQRARDEARDELAASTRRLFLMVVLAAALVVVAAGLLWVALRRWVTTPLTDLGAEVRTVSEGDYGHQIVVDGPPEVLELAGGIDAMRRTVVASYAAAVGAREEVEAQRRLLETQAEELRRSNTELEQFAYVASHDLQEPLRKVASFCQMLERRYQGQLDERADQYIAFAVDGAKRMQQLINDLLAFSRVGRMGTDFTEVKLDDCLGQALRTLEIRCEEAGAVVTHDSLPVIRGEKGLLTQVFQNFIGNALKFRGTDPPRVHIGVRRDGDHWEFSCADNGIGIEEQYADRIFVIFQRLHPKDEYTGTGIGLALCKKIVEYHGGRIWLATDSASGAVPHGASDALPHGASGALFRWTLPVAVEAENALQDVDGARSSTDQGVNA